MAIARYASNDVWEESTRQSVSLLTSNQTTILTRGVRDGISRVNAEVIHAALLPPDSVDAVSATMMVQGRYADSKRVIDRRLGIVDRIQDPLEVGDIHSLASWVANYIGHYRAAVTYAEHGFELRESKNVLRD